MDNLDDATSEDEALLPTSNRVNNGMDINTSRCSDGPMSVNFKTHRDTCSLATTDLSGFWNPLVMYSHVDCSDNIVDFRDILRHEFGSK
jgi:hypothetical protein